MTLIESRNAHGVVGRCDAKCYNAQHLDCDCICAGYNHGKGLEQAILQTREVGERWVEEFLVQHPGAVGSIADFIRQSDLFG